MVWTGTYGLVNESRALIRPRDYVPFQSVFQPDGRYAYNPQGTQYLRFDVQNPPDAGLYRRLLPDRRSFPRDQMLAMHWYIQQDGTVGWTWRSVWG